MRHLLSAVTLLLAATCATVSLAEVKAPPVFSDHMVLQRNLAAPVWGTAEAGEEVAVSIAGQSHTAKADAEGNWSVKLNPLKAGGPHVLSIKGSNTIKLKDVLVGDIWIGSGQSNMAGGVGGYAKRDEMLAELAAGTYPQLRLCRGKGGTWQQSNPQTNQGFSALLFAFGQRLQKDLDVPVGLILGAVGGTPSGRWLTDEMLANDTKTKTFKAANGGDLYKQHILPVVPYGIRGVLWDQGEAGTAIKDLDQFTTMGALIGGWRDAWGQGEFPFLCVQKPSGGGCAWDAQGNPLTRMASKFVPQPTEPSHPGNGTWRCSHVRLVDLPKTAVVIASDLGGGIHPPDKSSYGRRSCDIALSYVYGGNTPIYGPLYDSHEVEGKQIRVRFKHVGKGLVVRHSDKLQGFEIAGKDHPWYWAEARIEGDTVVVSSEKVPHPEHVRYKSHNSCSWANLFNKDRWPAFAFNTRWKKK